LRAALFEISNFLRKLKFLIGVFRLDLIDIILKG
jgi:hypothetical protein